MNRDEVVVEIYNAIKNANDMRAIDDRLACSEDTRLYGSGSGLDSLGLVSLVLDVEAAVNSRMGTHIVLADERAMSMNRNPFHDVQSLADYVMSRITELDQCRPTSLLS